MGSYYYSTYLLGKIPKATATHKYIVLRAYQFFYSFNSQQILTENQQYTKPWDTTKKLKPLLF